MNNRCIYWFCTHIFIGILIFKGLTARRLYKSSGVIFIGILIFKGLTARRLYKSSGVKGLTPASRGAIVKNELL
jgi:uncharacterized membrane protein YgdD (TMEM256/DUF423 family)